MAYYEEKTGKVRNLGRGVYLPSTASTEDVYRQAMDIAAYRYDNARLFGESARRVQEDRLTPAVQGVIHLATSTPVRRERDLIPGMLKVILHPESSVPSPFLQRTQILYPAIMQGETRRIRMPTPAQMLWDTLEDDSASPLSLAGCNPQAALRIWHGLTDMEQEALMQHSAFNQHMQKWTESTGQTKPLALPSRQTVEVFLQDIPWGRFYEDGLGWRSSLNKNTPEFPVPDENMQGFLQSLLPETEGDKAQMPHLFLEEPRRLMNLLIRPEGDATQPVVNHISEPAGLLRHTDHLGLFTGGMRMPESHVEDAFPDGHPAEPKLSGMQPKAPAFLDANGQLQMSLHTDPFTVLMKFDYDGDTKKAGIPVLEWACQQVARYAGLSVPRSALMVDGDGSRAALLSERFDVPVHQDAHIYLALDGAALLGVGTDEKYKVNPKQLWQRIQAVANGKVPAEHFQKQIAEPFFDRFALAWAMCDGDLHAKNLSALFSCAPKQGLQGGRGFTAWDMQIAPAYDTVCTRALPGFGNDRMALKIEGKDDGLSPALWERFGNMVGISHGGDRASRIAGQVANGFAAFAKVHPAALGLDGVYGQSVSRLLDRAADVTRERARYMGVDVNQMVTPEITEVMAGRDCVTLPGNGCEGETEDVSPTSGRVGACMVDDGDLP
jgi:hypothetical protein